MVSSRFFSYRASESTRTRVCPGAPPELVHPACRGAGESAPPAPGSLTGADGGKAPHVVEQLADDGTGPGVQPVTVDAQVELDPAGLESELQRGVQGSEVQLLSVYLVSSERDFFFFFNWRNKNAETCRNALSGLHIRDFILSARAPHIRYVPGLVPR